MFNSLRTLVAVLFSLMIFAGAAVAATGVVQGDIKGPDGKPIKDAKITIAMKDAKGAISSTKTDSKGHYSFNNLQQNSYTVSVMASGMASTTATDVRPKTTAPLRVDFNLKKQVGNQANTAMKKKATHMVWVPAETGSNLGGRWVEVDDQANADSASMNNVKRSGGGVLNNIQNGSGHAGTSGN